VRLEGNPVKEKKRIISTEKRDDMQKIVGFSACKEK